MTDSEVSICEASKHDSLDAGLRTLTRPAERFHRSHNLGIQGRPILYEACHPRTLGQ